jgi:hypothetical protein
MRFTNHLPQFLKSGAFLFLVIILTGCIPIPHTSVRSYECEGRVLDSQTHAPINGAKIYLTDYPSHSCASDATGHFLLKRSHNFHWAYVYGAHQGDLPATKSTDGVTFSHPDYVTLSISIYNVTYPGDVMLDRKK